MHAEVMVGCAHPCQLMRPTSYILMGMSGYVSCGIGY